MSQPEPVFVNLDEITWLETKAQMQGARRVSVRNKIVRGGPAGTFIYTKYESGMVIEEHGHRSNHIVFILQGSATFGDVECPPGMAIFLEQGATFGPIVAGPEGTELVEFYSGDPMSVSVDPAGFSALLAERGIAPLPPAI
jgi:hypothetical protein